MRPHFTFQPPYPARPQLVSHFPVSHAATGAKVYAPTFDCCATCTRPFGSSDRLFDYLIRNRIPSTVFLTGKWIESHPEATKRLMAAGHIELGFHGMTHNNFRMISSDPRLLAHEINGPRQIYNHLLSQAIHEGRIHPTLAQQRQQANLFRFPAGDFDERSLQAVRQAGMIPVQWNGVLDATRTPQMHRGQSLNGSILLGHANRSNRAVEETERTFPHLHYALAQQGYRAVTVSQLMQLQGAQIMHTQRPEPRTAALDRLDARIIAENARYNHGMGRQYYHPAANA